jgi:hypothetical protein
MMTYLFGAVVVSGVLLGVPDFVNRPAHCVKECGRTADLVLRLGYRAHRLDVNAVAEQFVVDIEQRCREPSTACCPASIEW